MKSQAQYVVSRFKEVFATPDPLILDDPSGIIPKTRSRHGGELKSRYKMCACKLCVVSRTLSLKSLLLFFAARLGKGRPPAYTRMPHTVCTHHNLDLAYLMSLTFSLTSRSREYSRRARTRQSLTFMSAGGHSQGSRRPIPQRICRRRDHFMQVMREAPRHNLSQMQVTRRTRALESSESTALPNRSSKARGQKS
jgi:hypothetical protein